MTLDLSPINDPLEDFPHPSTTLQNTLRQQELQDKASSHIRTLEEEQRVPQLTMLNQPTWAETIRTATIQFQNTLAQTFQPLEAFRLETLKSLIPTDLHNFAPIQFQNTLAQTLQSLEAFRLETPKSLIPTDLHKLLNPIKPFQLDEFQYNLSQSLIELRASWEAVQRQLVGPWPLVGQWRDAETLRWLLWALQHGDSDDQEAALAELASMIRRPRLTHEAGLQLHYRARLMGISTDEYWRRVVLPQALLFVWGARRVPRRIQLGGNGQDRVLDEQGKWTAQAPEDKLSKELLASYLFDEVPKAAICILTDQDYPKPSNELWHAPPIKKKDDQGTIERIPRVVPLPPRERDLTQSHGHICEPSPEVMAILKLDLQKLATNASPQQRQLLGLLVKGYKIKEIASELHITSQAVHAQLNRLQRKYEAG